MNPAWTGHIHQRVSAHVRGRGRTGCSLRHPRPFAMPQRRETRPSRRRRRTRAAYRRPTSARHGSPSSSSNGAGPGVSGGSGGAARGTGPGRRAGPAGTLEMPSRVSRCHGAAPRRTLENVRDGFIPERASRRIHRFGGGRFDAFDQVLIRARPRRPSNPCPRWG